MDLFLFVFVFLSLGVPHQRHLLRLHFPCHLQEIQQILWPAGMLYWQINSCSHLIPDWLSSKPWGCVLRVAWVCLLHFKLCEVSLTFWSRLSAQLLDGSMLSERSRFRLLVESAWKKGNGGNPVSRCRKKTWPQSVCRIQCGAKVRLRILLRDSVAYSESSAFPDIGSGLYFNKTWPNCLHYNLFVSRAARLRPKTLFWSILRSRSFNTISHWLWNPHAFVEVLI